VKLRESEVQGYFKSGGSSGGSCEVSPNYYILKFFFFFLTNNGMGTSMPIIKSFRPILLTAVTFFKTYHFLYTKILIFFNLILKN
jgi:hypothetical protein